MYDNRKNDMVDVMFELLRAGVFGCDPNISDDMEVDWDALMVTASDQGLLGWVWDGICKLPADQKPSRLQLINWGLSAQEIRSRYEKQCMAINDLVQMCDQSGMRMLLLKGKGLANLFPNPSARPSGDVDVYFFDDFEKANRLLGGEGCIEHHLHTSCDYKGAHIEIHNIFVYPNSRVKKRVGEYLLEEVKNAELTAEGFYIFQPLPNLVYLLMHGLNHISYELDSTIFPIKIIVDLAMFIKTYQSQLPSHKAYALMDVFGLEKSFELMVYMSEWLLNVDLSIYHKGLIDKRDLCKIKDMLMNRGLVSPIPKGLPIFKQSKSYWIRYRELKSIAKYVPKKPRCGLFRVTWKLQCSLIIRRLLHIPEGKPIRNSI